jgi:hypothetical protein
VSKDETMSVVLPEGNTSKVVFALARNDHCDMEYHHLHTEVNSKCKASDVIVWHCIPSSFAKLRNKTTNSHQVSILWL